MTSLTHSTASAVRAALAARGIRQASVAAALGLSQPAISQRLTGKTPFTLEDLHRLAELLGVPVTELLMPRADERVPA